MGPRRRLLVKYCPKVRVTAKRLLLIGSLTSLILGLLLITCGAAFQVVYTLFIELYTDNLDNELDPNVCVEPSTGIDFCNRRGDLPKTAIDDVTRGLASLLTIIGFLITISSILGFIGVYMRAKVCLCLLIVTACACIGVETYIYEILSDKTSTSKINDLLRSCLALTSIKRAHNLVFTIGDMRPFDYLRQFHLETQKELVSLLRQDYQLAMPDSDSFTHVANLIMLQGECCGITGRDDFGANLTFARKDGFVYSFHNPPACYNRYLLQEKRFKAFARHCGCEDSPPSFSIHPDINTEGCYTTVLKFIAHVYGGTTKGIRVYLIASHIQGLNGLKMEDLNQVPMTQTYRLEDTPHLISGKSKVSSTGSFEIW